jgi:hypothetical protein
VNTTDNQFEDRLLNELCAIVAANPAPVAASRPRRPLRRPALAGGAVAAVGITAVALVLTGGASAAYAVDTKPDGSVTVTIKSLKDAPGLERKLAAAGVNAVVDYVPAGKTCQQPRFRPASAGAQESMSVYTDKSGAATFTISRGQLTSTDTLVIESSLGDRSMKIGLGVAEGAVSPCELVDSTTPDTPPTGPATQVRPTAS